MKKKLLFLLMTILALAGASPDAAAWNFDGTMSVYIKGEGYVNSSWYATEMTYDNNYYFYYDVVANSTTLKIKFNWDGSDRTPYNLADVQTETDYTKITDTNNWSEQFYGDWKSAGCEYSVTSGNQYRIVIHQFYGESNPRATVIDMGSAVTPAPTMAISPDGGTFDGPTKEVTMTPSNATSWKYRFSESESWSADQTGAQTITIGNASATENQTITIYWSATGAGDTSTGSSSAYTLTYTAPTPVDLSGAKLVGWNWTKADGSGGNTWNPSATGAASAISDGNGGYMFQFKPSNSTCQIKIYDGTNTWGKGSYSLATLATAQTLESASSAQSNSEQCQISDLDTSKTYNIYLSTDASGNLQIRLAEAAVIPTMTITPNGGTFNATTTSVTLTPGNASQWWYTVGSGTEQGPFTDNQKTITIGDAEATSNQNITISWRATGTGGEANGTSEAFTLNAPTAYSITKVELKKADGTLVATISEDGQTYSAQDVTPGVSDRYYIDATLTNNYGSKHEYYYYGSAINANGEYTLIKEATHSHNFQFGTSVGSAKVNVDANGTTLTSLAVSDIAISESYNGINDLELWNCYSSSKFASFTREGTTFTAIVTVEKKDNDKWTARYYLKGNDKSGDTDNWKTYSVETGGVYTGADLSAGTTYTNVYYTTSVGGNGDRFNFVTGGKVKITVELDPSNLSKIKSFTYSPYKGAVEGVELYTCNNNNTLIGKFSYVGANTYVLNASDIKPCNVDGNWDERYFVRAIQDNDNTDYTVTAYKDVASNGMPAGTNYTLTAGTGGGNNDYFRFNLGGSLKIYVTVDPDNDDKLQSIRYVQGGLNFKPKVVRENDGDDSAWEIGEPIVFITANYLNNNQIVPDWEMSYNKSTERYELLGVTLRGGMSTSAANANKTLTANVLTKTTDEGQYNQTTFTCDPEGLETATERQYGRKYNLYFTYDKENGTGTLTAEALDDKLPPFISLVSYNYQQANDGVTPRGKSAKSGWQEAWVLYEGNNPLRDVDGNYFYSTQWPPKSSIRFKAINGDESMTLTSDRLQFKRDTNGAVKTGSSWTTDLKAQDATGYENLSLTGTQKYIRYVVDKAWLLGATKVWTGWGGQSTADGKALWSNHQNWGCGSEYADDKGKTIDPYTSYEVVKFAGNFMCAKPTYFQTIELFIPCGDDGIPTSTADEHTVFYTTAAYGSAQIAARDNANYEGEYAATICLPTGAKIKDGTVKVTRYWANTTDGYKMAGTLASNSDVEVHNVVLKEVDDDNYKVQSRDYHVDAALNNGSYFYQLTLTVVDANKVEHNIVVESNVFNIANYNMNAHVEPLQLLKLSDEKAALYGSPYITYRPANTGDYYFVNADNTCVTATKAEYDDIVDDRANFKFSSDFYVKALDGADYTEVFEGAYEVKEYDKYPEAYVITGSTAMTSTDAIDDNKAVRSSNRVYGRIINTAGDLSAADYTAGVKFSYKKLQAGSTTVTETITRNVNETYDSDNVRPEMPTAWGETYFYEVSQKVMDVRETYGYHDNLVFEVASSADPTKNVPVVMRAKDLNPRQLDCTLQFNRPNITDDIVDRYDIVYEMEVTTNFDGGSSLTASGKWYDEDKKNTPESYLFKVKGLHPSKSVYPTFRVVNTLYELHDDANEPTGEGADVTVANWGSEINVAAKTTTKKMEGSITGLKLNYYDTDSKKWMAVQPELFGGLTSQPGYQYEGISWLYNGHSEFTDPGDVIIVKEDTRDKTDDVVLENIATNDPHFYLIELKSGDKHTAYGYLVKHQYGHTELEDPLIGKWLGHNFADATPPTVYITPVYIFDRDGRGVGDVPTGDADTFTSLKKIGGTTGSNPLAVRRKAEAVTRSYSVEVVGSDVLNADGSLANDATATDFRSGSANYGNLAATPGGSTVQDLGEDASSVITGVELVNYDASGDAEYYNLQGVRVVKPEPGQVYIVRQGATATKVLVK